MKRTVLLLAALSLVLLMVPTGLSSAQSPSGDADVVLPQDVLCAHCGEGQLLVTILYGPWDHAGGITGCPNFKEVFDPLLMRAVHTTEGCTSCTYSATSIEAQSRYLCTHI